MARIGYFPGQPINKPYKMPSIPPGEYSADIFSKWVANVFNDLDLSRLPPAVLIDLKKDVERQWIASVTPKKAGYDVQRALEFGDVDETPGVSLEVNLNPLDWLSDPGKQATKTIDKLKKDIFNWDDIRNWAEKKYFWEPVISGRANLAPESSKSLFEPAETFAKNLMGVTSAPGPNPFQLSGLGVMRDNAVWMKEIDLDEYLLNRHNPAYKHKLTATKFQDVYEEAGKSFLKYMEDVQAGGSRNAAYHGLRYNATEAIRTELNNYIGKRINNPTSPDHLSLVRDADGKVIPDTTRGLNPALVKEVEKFSAGMDVADAMRTVRAGPIGKSGLAGARSNLAAFYMEGKAASGKSLAVNIANDQITVQGVLETIRDDVTKANKALSLAESKMTSAAEKSAFKKATNPFNKKLNELDELCNKYLGIPTKPTISPVIESKITAGIIKGRLDSISNGFLQPGYIKGFEHAYMNELVNNAFLNGGGLFGGKTSFRTVIDEVIANAKAAGVPTGLANIQNVLYAANPIYRLNDFADFIKNYEEGKLLKIYVWPKARTLLNGFTPAAAVGNLLASTHYFGLKYDPDYSAANIRASKGFDFYALKNDPNFVYDIKKDRWATFIPVNTVKINIGSLKGVHIEGGAHLKGALNMHDALTKVDIDKSGVKTIGRFGVTKSNIDAKGRILKLNDDGKSLIDLLNSKGGNGYKALTGDPKLAEIWLKENERFLSWLNKSGFGASIGLRFDTAGKLINDKANAGILLDLIQGLGLREKSNDYVSVLLARSGYLQIASSWANRIQTKIIQKIGPAVAAYAQIKNSIASWVSKILGPLMAHGLGVITGGTASFLAPIIEWLSKKIIEPIVRLLVDLFINKAIALMKGLLKGDLSDFTKSIFKLGNQTIKLILYAVALPAFILIALSYLFMGSVFTSIPPADPISGGGFVVDFNFPPGENAYVRIEKKATLSCCGVNPYKIENTEVDGDGFTVTYEVTITPKITITGSSLDYVLFSDKAFRRSENDATELFTDSGLPIVDEKLTVFNKGEPVVKTLGPYTIKGDDFYDSLVSNVASIKLPSLQGFTTDPQTIYVTRSFRIGNYISECLVSNVDYRHMTVSFTNANGPGHGTNSYWEGLEAGGTDACSFAIPFMHGDRSPLDENSVCYNASLASEYYGWALDVAPVNPATSGDYEISMPSLGGNTTWTLTDNPNELARNPNYVHAGGNCLANAGGSWGCGTYAISADGQYKFYITHTACPGTCSGTVQSGEVFGHLYTGWTAGASQIHLHIEQEVFNDPVEPQEYVCLDPQ